MLNSCSENNDVSLDPVSITLNFSHVWDETEVTSLDFNDIKFTNENGELVSIERLRYLISEITLTHVSGEVTTLNEYNLVNVSTNENLSYTTTVSVLPGDYSNISFRFGFSDANNTDGTYTDLNTANFNVPGALGGGYHYMQFDGKYIDNTSAEASFNYHAISAFDTTGTNDPLDTSFTTDLGAVTVGGNTNVNIQMDIKEWFKSPNTWDLNVLNTVLMPNYDAQIMMSENGATVFSLVDITQ
jgi:hypothetical protein